MRNIFYGGILWFFTVSCVLANETIVPQLKVRGEATLSFPADQVEITLGVLTEEETTEKAIARNSQVMQNIAASLASLGLTDKEYKTQHFRVQPVWSSRPNSTDQQWRSKIIAYQVNNRLRITTTKLESVGEIVANSLTAGANQVDSMYFSLANPRQYRHQAITEAMKNANADAISLIKASNSKALGILSLQLDNTSATPISVRTENTLHRSMAADVASLPPIEASDIVVKASVTVVYELARQDSSYE